LDEGGSAASGDEIFRAPKLTTPQSDRCAVNVWSQRDQTHHPLPPPFPADLQGFLFGIDLTGFCDSLLSPFDA
jgi:hypothetical protein